jgi:L,D-transpeptidase catalytic domain
MALMRAWRAALAAGAAVVVLASAASGSRAAEIIQIPQAPLAAEDTSDTAAPEPFSRLQLAQFPPPPFYIDPNPVSPRRWFEDGDRGRSARKLRRPRELPAQQNKDLSREQDLVRERLNGSQPLAGERLTREPNYFLTRHLRGNYKQRIATVLRHSPRLPAAKGPLLLTISIAKQTITAYDAGVQVAKGPVSTGMPGHPTPAGIFSVLDKEWWHRSNIYSGAPMPLMQRLTWSGIALHAGELPGYRASHGCIRLPESLALRLWYMSSVGARVVIAWNELSPTEIAHPLLFQPHAAPQPPAPAAPSTSVPSEDPPVSMKLPPSPQDVADAERDHMMLAAVDDGESAEQAAYAGRPGLQFALGLTRLESGNTPELQPVLELLSARRKPAHREYARAPEAEYEAVSTPRPGSISVFISRRDGRIYVRKDAQPLFDMPVMIAEPMKTIGTHVFTAVALNDSLLKLRWTVVSPTNEPLEDRTSRRQPAFVSERADIDSKTPAAALDRITLPQDAIDRIDALVSIGTTLIVSDAGLGRTAAVPNADFSVLLH